jgi:hypothetical protein
MVAAFNMGTNICLPFLKFSHAAGVRNDNSIPWVHVTADDLVVVVKGDVNNTHLVMRVLQRNRVLVCARRSYGTSWAANMYHQEDLDIGRYIDSAAQTRQRFRQASVNASVDQLPIFGLTKGPLLALRYRQSDGQVCTSMSGRSSSTDLLYPRPVVCSFVCRRFQTASKFSISCVTVVWSSPISVLEQHALTLLHHVS